MQITDIQSYGTGMKSVQITTEPPMTQVAFDHFMKDMARHDLLGYGFAFENGVFSVSNADILMDVQLAPIVPSYLVDAGEAAERTEKRQVDHAQITTLTA